MNNPIYESNSEKNCAHCINWKPHTNNSDGGECFLYPFDKVKDLIPIPDKDQKFLYTYAYHCCELFDKQKED